MRARAAGTIAPRLPVRWDLSVADGLAYAELLGALRGEPLHGRPQGAFSVRAANDFFVAPQLNVKLGLDDLAADVILVSARGAAGKSTTAQQMSHDLDVPLWKLEEDTAVSATALSFVLGQYLGTVDVAQALGQMARPTILIDSLDEARARVSGTSWTEFMQSLAASVRDGLRLVILGRERTLEEVWLTLEDAGLRQAWLEISHFGPDERTAYVDGRTAQKARSHGVVESPPYPPARDAILGSLVGSLTGLAADMFVGYAPVLDAVATVLARDNLFTVANTFDASHGGARAIAELRRILDRLLEREQTKVGGLATDLGVDPGSTFTPDEQVTWLASELLGASPPSLDYIKEPQQREKYRQQVGEFLQDHPFRTGKRWASTVFGAYVAYRRFGSIPGDALLRVGNDSGLLFDFFSLDGAAALIDEKQFGALHASITAGEFSGVSANVTTREEGDGEHEVVMHVVRAGESSELRLSLLASSPDTLALHGPLEALTVVTGNGVTIPARAPVTVLGPDLFIACGALTIEGLSVEFSHRAVPADDGTESGQVILQVSGELSLPVEITREPLEGDFELLVPSTTVLQYPWIKYRVDLADETSANPSGRSERFLNMLMNLSRAHGHSGDRGCYVMKLQGRQSVKGEEFRAVIAKLIELGVVRTQDDMVYVTPQFEKHRFSGKTQPGQRLLADVWGLLVVRGDRVGSRR